MQTDVSAAPRDSLPHDKEYTIGTQPLQSLSMHHTTSFDSEARGNHGGNTSLAVKPCHRLTFWETAATKNLTCNQKTCFSATLLHVDSNSAFLMHRKLGADSPPIRQHHTAKPIKEHAEEGFRTHHNAVEAARRCESHKHDLLRFRGKRESWWQHLTHLQNLPQTHLLENSSNPKPDMHSKDLL